MRHHVSWETEAVEKLMLLSRTDPRTGRRIVQAVRRYANGDSGDVIKLHGNAEEWRLRVGDLRVIFTILPSAGGINVLDVLNRRDAYD